MRLISQHAFFAHDPIRKIQFALLLGLVLIALTMPAYFFDREHILLVLTLPYVLRFMPSLSRSRISLPLRLLIGLMAAIGFCIKPHTVVVFIGLQLLYYLRERSARILVSVENRVLYSIVLLYLLAVEIVVPEYFSLVLPMALATYSGYINSRFNIGSLLCAAFIFAVTFIDFRLRYSSPVRTDIFYLVGASVLWLLYALMNNGWGYTYNPLLSMLLITCGFVLWEYLYLKQQHASQGLSFKPFVFGARACFLNFGANAFFALYTFTLVFTTTCADFQSCESTEKLVNIIKEKHITTYGALTINFHLLPMIDRETGAQLQTRFNALWMLPKFLKEGHAFTVQHQSILDYVGHSLAQDLDRNRPQLVLVSSDIKYKNNPTDLPKFFSVYPDFKAAWSHYHLLPEAGAPVADSDFPYHLYERIP